jgi:hypothetical protein
MPYPIWITTPAGKSLIVHDEEQHAREMAVDEDNRPIPVASVEVEAAGPAPEVVEPPQGNVLVNSTAPVESRLFQRGPGRPKGSKNR